MEIFHVDLISCQIAYDLSTLKRVRGVFFIPFFKNGQIINNLTADEINVKNFHVYYNPWKFFTLISSAVKLLVNNLATPPPGQSMIST